MNEYKQQIIDFYAGRDDYDNEFTEKRALSLLELVPIKTGQQILDVATGTGFIALEAAKKVGKDGKVIAIDFSEEMLQRCQNKINITGLTNIELRKIDADILSFPDDSFDVIFCSLAIVLFTNVINVLTNWYHWLKPNGYIAFSNYSQESFFTPIIVKICHESGYNLPNLHQILGTEEKCQHILQNIGYKQITLKNKQFGKYLTLSEAQNWWHGNWLHPKYHPLLKLNEEKRESLKNKFKIEIAKLETNEGVWDENKIFLITAQK